MSGMSCAFNSPVSTRPLASLKTNVFIDKGFIQDGPSLRSRNPLNFFEPQTNLLGGRDENMAKINKYQQNNHNARGANRRERRVNPNLRVKNARYLRTLAETPTVQILTISNVPSDVLDAIDQLAAGQDRSRSSFVRRELRRIVSGYREAA